MPWIFGEKRGRDAITHGKTGLVFAKDKAGRADSETQSYQLRVRLGLDVLDKTRWMKGDYIAIQFDPESRRILLRRLSEDERKEGEAKGMGRKLCYTSGNGKAGNTCCYLKTNLEDKWMAVLFPNGSRQYTPSDIQYSRLGVICEFPQKHD